MKGRFAFIYNLKRDKGGVMMTRMITVVTGILFLLGSTGMASDLDKKNPAAKPKPKPSHSVELKKVDTFLDDLLKAGSLDDLSRKYKGSKFSTKETRQIEQELKKGEYRKKMNLLHQKAEGIALRKLKSNAARLEKRYKDQFMKAQMMKISRSNQQARSKMTRISPKPLAPGGAGLRAQPLPASIKSELAAAVMAGSDAPRITSFSPEPVFVGQDITLRGVRFGSRRGTVSLVLNDLLIECRGINDWFDTRVDVTIPQGIEPMVGESTLRGYLILTPAGSDQRARAHIRIASDLASRRPEVESLSSDTIQPGQLLLVEGRNFLSGRGRVEMQIAGESFPCSIEAWADNYVAVMLNEDISGKHAGRGSVRITNTEGRLAAAPIRFEPIIVREVIQIHEGLKALGLVGSKERVNHNDFTLINGWRVVENSLEGWGMGIAWGSKYLIEPAAGSDQPKSRILMWADMCSAVSNVDTLVIEGPRGFEYQ